MTRLKPTCSSLERRAKSPARKKPTDRPPSATNQAFWSVLTQGLILLSGVASAVLLNRMLMPAGRGQVAAASLWPMILATLAVAGWANANTWYVSRYSGKARAVWSSTMLVALIVTTIATVAGYALMPLLLGQYPAECRLARWFLLVIPAHMILMAGTSVLEGLGQFRKTLWIRAGTALLILTLLGILASFGLLTPASYLGILLCASFFIAITSIAVVSAATDGSWRPEWSERPGFAMRAAPQSLTKIAFDQFGLILATSVLVPDAVILGVFVASVNVAQLLVPFTVGISTVLLPETARRSQASALDLYRRSVLLLLLSAAVLGLPVAIFSGRLLSFAFGEAYSAGSGFLQLSIVCTMAMAILSFGTATVQGLGRPEIGTIANVAAAFFGILAAAALLSPLGLYGILLGKLAGCTVGLGILQYLLVRSCRRRTEKFAWELSPSCKSSRATKGQTLCEPVWTHGQ